MIGDVGTISGRAKNGEFLRTACRMCGSSATDRIGDAEGYPFVECADCGFVFIPSVQPEQIEPKYRGGEAWAEAPPEEGWADDPSFLAPAFERLGDGGALHILDFGCGYSRTPDRLRRQGHRVTGIDLVPPRRPHPDRLTGSILKMDMPTEPLDLVYAYQVFEHLPEPRPIFEELLRLTRPGGFVLIHTDMETPQRREQGFFDWFYVLPPDHCSYFRERTFEKALKERDARLAWSNPWSVLVEVGS